MRKIFCKKYQKELDGLVSAPFPGIQGENIFNHISQKAWNEWLGLQTMLINEKSLNAFDKESREYLATQREKFFNNEDYAKAEGYIEEK